MCSTVSTVLDMLRLLIVAWSSPVQLRIMNGRKPARVASSPISICCLLVIIIDANSNKTKMASAVVAVSIAAGA